jgi:TatD DNase family protein
LETVTLSADRVLPLRRSVVDGLADVSSTRSATTLPMMTSLWVDTHCHLQLSSLPVEGLLERAADVEWMVVPGIDLDSTAAAEALAGQHPERLLFTAGLHPHDASEWPEQRDGLAPFFEKAAAVGEIGLDFYRNLSPREAQIEAFRDQIRIGLELGKPLVVHVRDAFRDSFEIVDELGAGSQTVLHCWTGGPKWTKRFMELGVTFSFAGPIAFETGDTVRRAAAVVPPGRAMVETDTPYLSPPPFRGQDNEPARVALVGRALAGVWGMDVDEVARLTSETATRVFRS